MSTCGQPLVSIVTPSFEQARFIGEALESVAVQDYPKVEHVVIDGGSADGTVSILRQREKLGRLRWISEADAGQADAINKGVGISSGDIIGWLNADDVYFDRQAIGSVVDVFKADTSVDVVYGDAAYIGEDGHILRLQCVPRFRYWRLLRGCFLEQPAVFFRRRVLEECKLNVQCDVAVDYEYWLRIGRNFKFQHLRRIVAADRNHVGRISLVQSDRLRQVSEELRHSYEAQVGSVRKGPLVKEFGFILGGAWRRLWGLLELVRLQGKRDFAFDAKLDLGFGRVVAQLWPPELARLLR